MSHLIWLPVTHLVVKLFNFLHGFFDDLGELFQLFSLRLDIHFDLRDVLLVVLHVGRQLIDSALRVADSRVQLINLLLLLFDVLTDAFQTKKTNN